MSRSRGGIDHDARHRALRTAEARVVDLDLSLAALKDVKRILQREDVSELQAVQSALERVQIALEDLEQRQDKAISGRGAERHRAKEG